MIISRFRTPAGLLVAVAALSAGSSARTEPSAPITIPQGTRVRLRLKQELKSGKARRGDPVRFELAADVKSPDGKEVLIPAGTLATGAVLSSHKPGSFGRPGRLQFTCSAIRLPGGAE